MRRANRGPPAPTGADRHATDGADPPEAGVRLPYRLGGGRTVERPGLEDRSLYFTLKDGNAQIRGVMFRSAVRTLRFEPEDGLHVVARGRVTVYEPKGEYQLVAEHFEPAGVGARQLAFDQLRQRLEREGLFATERKRALPMLPRRIGIVTSRDGAALHDILTVLSRRFPTAQVVISPARVQGHGAAGELTDALDRVARVAQLDVVILGRGGGSAEDLWAFNDEQLARAIAACPVPVISAVGHDDHDFSDRFAADIRAATLPLPPRSSSAARRTWRGASHAP